MTSTWSLFKNRQPCQTLTTQRQKSIAMDSYNPFPSVRASKPSVSQVCNDSFHHSLSLRPVTSVPAEMDDRDVFLMAPIMSAASWAARSTFAGGPSCDQPSTSSHSQMYGAPNQPIFPSNMFASPHHQSQHPPSLHPADLSMMSMNPQHDQQRFQQQQHQRQQDMTVNAGPQPVSGQQGSGESSTSDVKGILKTKKRKLNTKKKVNQLPVPLIGLEAEKKPKRGSNPLDWTKRKRKLLRDRGEEYVTVQGKIKKARCVQPLDCSKCRFRCSQKIPEEARQAIHNIYWNLASYERQRAFVAQHVEQNDIKQAKSGSRREVANSFFFVHKRKEHRVCKAFFCKTLDITSKVVDVTMKKTESGVYVGRDERGRRDPVNKTKPEDAEFIRWHISSFPTIDGAKGKKNSGAAPSKHRKQYLSQDLNVRKMYRMYKDLCERTGRTPRSVSKYRNTFNNEFNLAFQKPKKEHCASCKCGEGSKTKTKSACGKSASSGPSQPGVSMSDSQVFYNLD